MARLAIDLGNLETRLTFESPEARSLLVGIGRPHPECPRALSVPSLIHLADPVLLGKEVLERRRQDAEATFSDLKDHVIHRIGGGRLVGGARVTHKKAASIFLTELLRRARSALGRDPEVVLLYPLTGRESVEAWLAATAVEGARSVTLLDEDTAVALGYQVDLTRDNPLLVFDFGSSSIRARVLQFTWRGRKAYSPPWLRASAVLPTGYAEAGGGSRGDSVAAEAASRVPPSEERTVRAVRQALDLLFDEARIVGLKKEGIRAVLLTGKGITPRVQQLLEAEFGGRVLGHAPLEAAGRGGCAFLTGAVPASAVQELCTLQARDPVSGEYYYPVIVEEWTEAPTSEPVASYVVNTYYDGQKAIDLRLFRTRRTAGEASPREVVFDVRRKIAFSELAPSGKHEPALEVPVVIPVDPPGKLGERRFRLEFKVNAQKDLLLTVEDLKRGNTIWDERSLFRLH